MKKFFKILAVILSLVVLAIVGIIVYVVFALPNVGPAPDMHVEITKERLARGQYLATSVMLCVDCHGTRNWEEFAGPVLPGTFGKGGDVFDKRAGFPGVFYAANITPAGIGTWTDGEVFRAITTGVKKDGSIIFPVMPYHLFGQADEEDLKSVIAYIRSLPSIENKVPDPKPDFPMNIILHTIPQKAQLQTRPSESDSLAYGKYMFTIAACHECHTPVNNKGQFTDSLTMAGGREFMLPGGTVTSSNLSPDVKSGIGAWTKEQFLARFAIFRDSAMMHRPIGKNDFQTIMPWEMYAQMSEKDLGYIYSYLRTIQPKSHLVRKFKPAGN